MTLVSICIPTCNRARYIGETIQSVLHSTYTNLEIVVSDNASTDNTQEIVERFGDERIRYYRNSQNLGPIRNWNCAVQKAQGELVGLLFSDDLIGPFWIGLAVHALRKHPHAGWAASAFRLIDETGKVLGSICCFPQTRVYTCAEAFSFMARLDGLGPAYIARRELLEEIGFYDEEAGLFADHDLFLRLAAKSPLYYSINNHHAAYRRHKDEQLVKGWTTVQQMSERLHMLRKVFRDETLAAELQQYERPAFLHYYKVVVKNVMRYLEQDDLETARQLIRLLAADSAGKEALP